MIYHNTNPQRTTNLTAVIISIHKYTQHTEMKTHFLDPNIMFIVTLY